VTRIQPWTEAQLMEREDVFEALTAKVVKKVMRSIGTELRSAVLTAATAPQDGAVSLPPAPPETAPPVSFTSVEGAVMAVWSQAVEHDLTPFLVDTFTTSASRIVEALADAGQTGVDVLTDVYAEEFLAYAHNRMVGVGQQLWEQLRDSLQTSFKAGLGIKEAAAALQEVAELSIPRALTVARTEIISAANAGSYLQMLNAGFDDGEVTKVWLATEDPRTRKSHRHADNQGVSLTGEFSLDIYSGDVKTGTELLEFPGDPTGTPGNVINCRCSLAFDFIEDTLTAAWREQDHPRDGDGRFVSLFHGTDSASAQAIREKGFDSARSESSGTNVYGAGAYLTRDKSAAEGYAARSGGEVLEFSALLENPADGDSRDVARAQMARELYEPVRIALRLGLPADAIWASTQAAADAPVSSSLRERFDRPEGTTKQDFVALSKNDVIKAIKRTKDRGSSGAWLVTGVLQEMGYDGVIVNEGEEVLVFDPDSMQPLVAAKNWIETQHPRDKDGKFKEKGSADKYVPIPDKDAKPSNSDPSIDKVAWMVAHKWESMTAGQKGVLIKNTSKADWKKLPPELKNKMKDAPSTTSHPESKNLLEQDVQKLINYDLEPDDDADGDAKPLNVKQAVEKLVKEGLPEPAATPAGGRPQGGVDAKTGKQLTPGKATKLRVQLLYNTTFEDGAVMAVRKESGERIVWQGGKVRRQKLVGGKYQTTSVVTRGDAYKQWKDEEGWTIPDGSAPAVQEAEAAPATVAAPAVGKPVALKVQLIYQTPFNDGDTVAVKPSTGERITWDAGKKRMVVHAADGSTTEYTRGALYKAYKDDTGWHLPGDGSAAPEAPAAPKTTAQTLEDLGVPPELAAIATPAPTPAYVKPEYLDDTTAVQIGEAAKDPSVLNSTFLFTTTATGMTGVLKTSDGKAVWVDEVTKISVPIEDGDWTADSLVGLALEAKGLDNPFKKKKKEAEFIDFKPVSTLDDVGSEIVKGALGDSLVAIGTTVYSGGGISIVKKSPGVGTVKTPDGQFDMIAGDISAMGVIGEWNKFKAEGSPAVTVPGAPAPMSVAHLTIDDVADMTDLYESANIDDVLLDNDAIKVEKADNVGGVLITSKVNGNVKLIDLDTAKADHFNEFIDENLVGDAPGDAAPSGTTLANVLTPQQVEDILNANPGSWHAIGPVQVYYNSNGKLLMEGADHIISVINKGDINAENVAKMAAGVMNGMQWGSKDPIPDIQLTGFVAPGAAGAVSPGQDFVGSTPDLASLKATGQTLGTHGGKVYRDANGDNWLFKPNPSGFSGGAQADLATAKLHKLAGLPTPDTAVVTLNGQQGSIQKMIPDAKEPWGVSFNPKSLTDSDMQAIQLEHAFDWMVANHDAHAMNLLKDKQGNVIGIDKGQSFKYFGADKLSTDFNPNEHKQAANVMYSAMEKGQVYVPLTPATKAFMLQLGALDDATYKEILRPYAVKAAASGQLAKGGPAYLGMKDVPFAANDVEAFLDAAVARKNSLFEDYSAFHASTAAKFLASGGVVPSTINPPAVSAPSQIPGVPAKQVPFKMSHAALVGPKSTKYTDGQVIAEHPENGDRLLWNAKKKQFVFQSQDTNGKWTTVISYNKQAALANLKDEPGWMTPSTPQAFDGGPTPGQAGAPSVYGSPVLPHQMALKIPDPANKPKSIFGPDPKFTPDELQKQADQLNTTLTDTQKNTLYTAFRTKGKGGVSTVKLASEPQDQFEGLLEAYIAFKESNPSVPTSLLAILRAVDDIASTKANKPNTNTFENSVIGWLQSPAGAEAAKNIAQKLTLKQGSDKKLIEFNETIAKFQKTANSRLKGTPSYKITAQLALSNQQGIQLHKDGQEYPHLSFAEANAFGKEMTEKYGPIPPASLKGMKDYTGNSYTSMNANLRTFGHQNDYHDAALRAAEKGMKPSTRAITVHRNVGTVFDATWQPTVAQLKDFKGVTFREDAFASTSIGGHVFNGHEYRFIIEIPEGTPLAWVDNFSKNSGEKEILLGSGLHYEIIDVYEGNEISGPWASTSHKKAVIKLRVVPPPADATEQLGIFA
jgi:hypothetical protein